MTDTLLDTLEASHRLRVARQTLAKWRLEGSGPPFIRVGRKILYREQDISAWLDSRTVRSTTEADRRGRAA